MSMRRQKQLSMAWVSYRLSNPAKESPPNFVSEKADDYRLLGCSRNLAYGIHDTCNNNKFQSLLSDVEETEKSHSQNLRRIQLSSGVVLPTIMCALTLLPNLAPPDYYMFTAMKKWFGRHHFANDEELKKAVIFWFKSLAATFYAEGIDGDRFNSCQVIYSQFGLAIHQNDHQARRRFVEWAQNEIAVVPYFHKRILFSDGAHFWLNGYVNKKNCRIWSEANPKVYVETPLHPEKLTVWCALWAGGIIGPYFFKNDEGHNVTVNGAVVPTRTQTCHTARATIDLLKDTFGDRLISRFGPVNWPPRSCDLTPLDYFLWGYVKSLVYADKPKTLDHLEDNIRRVIADIRPQMLEKVIENWTSRLDYIRASRGNHMPEIIFKMTATAGSDVVQSGRPIFDDFFQHLWPYIGNNTANVVFQMVKRLWLIRIDQ
ncbi:putative transposase [Trichonephila clavipes]|nr:putative transposase [Trichonephila clavipes]